MDKVLDKILLRDTKTGESVEYQLQDTQLKARVENLILNAGSTEGNSELIDLRVGVDGTTYETAGNSVRTQFSMRDLKSENIEEIPEIKISIDEINEAVKETSSYVDKMLQIKGDINQTELEIKSTVGIVELAKESAIDSANAAKDSVNDVKEIIENLESPVPISNGGTGATTARVALQNLGLNEVIVSLTKDDEGNITYITADGNVGTIPMGSQLDGFNIGDIKWSSADLTQAGFLVANGAEVGRATYPDLCAVYEAMGFPWGAGDGSTTFNLPNLIGKFPEGADSAGGYHEAGLPNIEGTFAHRSNSGVADIASASYSGAFSIVKNLPYGGGVNDSISQGAGTKFDASKSNSIYGSSTTVQPPSALLIPYVKAFAGASANSTDLAITEVANDVARISERVERVNERVNENVYLVESVVNDDGSWYRKYSDGWLEQGGINNSSNITTLLKPFANSNYAVQATTEAVGNLYGYDQVASKTPTQINWYLNHNDKVKVIWSACGKS